MSDQLDARIRGMFPAVQADWILNVVAPYLDVVQAARTVVEEGDWPSTNPPTDTFFHDCVRTLDRALDALDGDTTEERPDA